MIQLVDSIRGTLFANVEVNHVVTMLACECKIRDSSYSTIFYETRLDDSILSQNDIRICLRRITRFDPTNYSNLLLESSFESRELGLLIYDKSKKFEQ